MNLRSVVRVGALVCAASLFAACGGSDKKDASPPTTVQTGDAASTVTTAKANDAATTSSAKPCEFITEAQASTLFGHPAKKKDAPSLPPDTVACLWESKPEQGTSYLLQIHMSDKPVFYTGDLPGFTPLSGLGDKAAIRVAPTGSEVFISWVDGNNSNNVTYGVHKIGAKGLAEAQKDQLIALVKQSANT